MNLAASLFVSWVILVTASAVGPEYIRENLDRYPEIERDYARGLVARLVQDLEKAQEIGRQTPSMVRFRRHIVNSSDVVSTSSMLGQVQMSAALISQITRPSGIQEIAMGTVIDFGVRRHTVLLREIQGIEIPDGPDHPLEFQPRPQAGGAVGGTFSDFQSEDEREEYEKNYRLMKLRNEVKVHVFVLEQELKVIEQDLSRLVRLVDSACDPEGKMLLRRMLRNANHGDHDFIELLGLSAVDE